MQETSAAREHCDQILDLAELRIMTRGYNAFSYHDLAAELGIKTASVHYHFPKKEDLGKAVVRRSTERILAVQEALDADASRDEREKLECYLEIFLTVSATGERICLCGSLGGEIVSLPEELRSEVVRFFDAHEDWLTKLFEAGRERGVLRFEGSAHEMACLVFSSLEGALIVSRSRNAPEEFRAAVGRLKRLLGCDPAEARAARETLGND